MQTENLYTPNSLRTYSGKYVNILSPKAADIVDMDIAIALSRICRFGGHTKKFYSVANHSILCMQIAKDFYKHLPNLPLIMLLHDAHEYLLGDVPSPLKKLLTDYDILANRLQKTINLKYGVVISPAEAAACKEIDKKALEMEWQQMMLGDVFIGEIEKEVQVNWLHCLTDLLGPEK